jgi:pimeloyl-ACP methyl ester carboxylesterase
MVLRTVASAVVILIISVLVPLRAQEAPAWRDPASHQAQFVTVDNNVRLEVLDWGGSGRPLVLLAGLGNTAHVYDDFAPKLTANYHVYGITRRGFGASSVPDAGYDADEMGDDVLAVLDSLKLTRPVLAGHSYAGSELSSIGSRHPDRVAGLVYFDAVFPYSFDNGNGPSLENLKEMNTQLQKAASREPAPTSADLASFAAYQAYEMRKNGRTLPEAEYRMQRVPTPDGSVGNRRASPRVIEATMAGLKKFADIRAPVLAFIAVPQNMGPWWNTTEDPEVRRILPLAQASKERVAKNFEESMPSAHVVRMPNAGHYVFITNEGDVIREMNAFVAGLK